MPVAVPLAIAGSTLAASAISSSAAKSAAKTEANAATNAANVQQQMYGQTRADLAPFRDIGASAGTGLSALLGLNGSNTPAMAGTSGRPATANVNVGDADYAAYVRANPDLLAAYQAEAPAWGNDMAAFGQNHYNNFGQTEGRALPTAGQFIPGAPTAIQTALEATPGYQFTRDQGIQTVNRQLGSRGLTGAQAKGIARFVTGLADSTYNSQVANYQNAANAGGNAAAQTGNIGQAYGSNIGNNIVGAGQASAAGTVGAANAISGGLGSIPGALYANKILGGSGTSASGIYGPWTQGSAGAEDLAGLY